MHKQITTHIERSSLLAPLQFGFRRKLSAEDDVLIEAALKSLQENIEKLENYFNLYRLNLNGSKTEFITFSRKNDERHINSESVVVAASIIEKQSQSKYLGSTIDQHLGFQTQVKKLLKNIALAKPSKLFKISFLLS